MEGITLVTGGTGFIGGHLVETLVDTGRKVRCLIRKNSDIAFLEKLGVELICGDLLDKESLKRAVRDVDTIYHLAAQARFPKVISKFGELSDSYQRVNVLGTKNLVEASLAQKISRFIYFSSISAVGAGLNLTEDSPCHPNTDYGKSKLEAEKYLLTLYRKNNFPAVIIRPGLIYGPRSLAMPLFFNLIKHGFFPTFGNGFNWIPLCYVSDLIRGVLLAEEKAKAGDAYFIFEKVYMFKECVQTIAKILGRKLGQLYFPKSVLYAGVFLKGLFENTFRFKIHPFRIDLDKIIALISTSWFGSIDKAKVELGYFPEIDLNQGMKLTIKWYKDAGLL